MCVCVCVCSCDFTLYLHNLNKYQYHFDPGDFHSDLVYLAKCKFIVKDFELQSGYYVHFPGNILMKGMNSFMPATIRLISSLMFFYEDGCRSE